jgi:hypothetical protein
MIGNVVVVMVPVEIDQDKEAVEAEPSPPEWRWDPIIEIGVFPGGCIISNDRRFVVGIVILKNRGLH